MKLQFFKFKLPFSKPFSTASRTFNAREGILIQLKKNGLTALGEASPLPGFSSENINQVVHELRSHQSEIKTHFTSSFSLRSTNEFLKLFDSVPSLQFGLLTTAATFLAQQENASLQQLLFQTNQQSVRVNAVFGTGSQTQLRNIDQAVKKGFQTIKLKVDSNFTKSLQFIENIRSKYPDLNIRIDANRSWSSDQATTFLTKLQPFHIEYCEEPLRDPDAKSIQTINENCSIPVALDESVFQRFTVQQSLDIASVIVVKPMVWGSKYINYLVRNIANFDNTNFIFTTSLESGLGRLMTATMAAGLGSPTIAHGLNTGHMLANDIWTGHQFIKNGCFQLPDADRLEMLMNTKLSSLNLQEIPMFG